MEADRQLRTHVSRMQLDELAAVARGETDSPTRTLRGAVLFTDLAAFTPLAEHLSSTGPYGAETVSEVLNVYFGAMIDAVAENGGDVLLFAGDALVAWFEALPSDGSLANAVARASQSALTIQQRLDKREPVPGATLNVRASIGAGELTTQRVGGLRGQWLSLAGGAAMREAFESRAAAGTVRLTPSAVQAAADRVEGERASDGAMVVRALRLPARAPALPGVTIDDALSRILADTVLRVVRETETGGAEYLAEFRDLSIVFVGMPGIDPADRAHDEKLRSAAHVIQEELQRLNGVVYQMLADDKGTHAVAVFGLPGQAHDDDAARAADAAVAVRTRLADLGIAAGCGVATGTLFCGIYGGNARSHYGIIGPSINRASRLMQAAGTEVLCDEATRRRAERWMSFTSLRTVTLKGVAEPVQVFAPAGRASASAGGIAAALEPAPVALIGRVQETEALRERMAQLRDSGVGGCVIVEAEAGMGKTTLLDRAVEIGAEIGLQILEGAAEPIEENTPFFAFRPVVRQLLGITDSRDAESARAAAIRAIADIPSLRAELAPLLNAVLPLDFTDNELTVQMTGSIRAENVSNMLVALVRHAVAARPLMLVFEDLHWMDGASLALCGQIADAVPSVLLIATSRPMDVEPPGYIRLRTGSGHERMMLEVMSPDETLELVRRRLGVVSLPVAVKELVLAKAEGNPFYSEELAIALRETGVIEIVDGECRVVGAGGLSDMSLPPTVKGVITSRIDRLDAAPRLTLKVASVIGRVFELPVLEAIHPVSDADRDLRAQLDALVAAELVVPQSAGTYAFRHALTHETAYSSVAFAQRRPLHRATAEQLETKNAADLSPVNARLAFHWTKAEVPEKAIGYLGEAGKQALEAYANQSAVDFFAQAIRLDEGLRGDRAVDLQRARWHRQLAEGWYSLVEHEKARTHYEQAIKLCGFPMPRFGVATPTQVIAHVASRFMPKLLPQSDGSLPAEERERCIEALRACDNLQVIHLWQGDKLSLVHTVFEGVNIARRAGPSSESAFARAMVGYFLAMAGLRNAALRDLHSAVAMAEASGALLQRVSCNMYLGMTYSLIGRPAEGIPFLTRADELAGRLGAGLWKHRGKFMLAEPHMMTGNLEHAAELFGASASLAAGVEPPITGFANAMKALCWIRLGRVDEALALVNGPAGIQLVRDNPMGLQLYNAIAALLEGYVWKREYERALPLGIEALELAEAGDDCNSFLTGYNGHAAVARYFLTLLEEHGRATPPSSLPSSLPSVAEVRAYAKRALTNSRKNAKTFPAARTPYLLMRGWLEQLDGEAAKAKATWEECVTTADAMGMPYEAAMAQYEMGRHAMGDDASERLADARARFEKIGMMTYAARCTDAARSQAAPAMAGAL